MDIHKRLEELKEEERKLRDDERKGIEGASEALWENLVSQHEIESVLFSDK